MAVRKVQILGVRVGGGCSCDGQENHKQTNSSPAELPTPEQLAAGLAWKKIW